MGTVDEELAWDAVLRRDLRFVHAFVYAVRTTGVFCRTGCASRRPRRENVRFYRTPEEAASAGFRACKRCRPNDEDPLGAAITRACLYIEEHLDEAVTLERLGQAVGISPSHLQRTFKQRTGVSPKEYADALRLARLKTHLREGGDVTRAIYDAGYASPSSAYAAGEAHLGMTPATYQAGGRGARISFAVVECALGKLLVARTERGVCAITLGDSEAALEQSLHEEFPLAEIERAPAQLVELCRQSRRRLRAGRTPAETSPWTCVPLGSSGGCGGRCGRFRPDRRAPTATSPR